MAKFLVIITLFSLATTAWAKRKYPYWLNLEVDAYIDEQGTLHVKENHDLVMDGLVRRVSLSFPYAPENKLKVISVHQYDVVKNVRIPYKEGELDKKGTYKLDKGRFLSWLISDPNDPPFDKSNLNFIIEYKAEKVLQKDRDYFLLQKDFAYKNRPGVIENFKFNMTLASRWRPVGRLPKDLKKKNIAQRQDHVIEVKIREKEGLKKKKLLQSKVDQIIFCTAEYPAYKESVKVVMEKMPDEFIRWPEKLTFTYRVQTSEDDGYMLVKSPGIEPLPIIFINDDKRRELGPEAAEDYVKNFRAYIPDAKTHAERWMTLAIQSFYALKALTPAKEYPVKKVIKDHLSYLAGSNKDLLLILEENQATIQNEEIRLRVNEIVESEIEGIPVPSEFDLALSETKLRAYKGRVKLSGCMGI